MKKIILPILLGFALIAVSCEQNLDIPQKGKISTLEFYANDADAEAALANMYAQYAENVTGYTGNGNPEQFFLNYSADDILAAGKNFEDHAFFRVFDEFTYDNSNDYIKQLYQRYYYAIYHANLVISNFTTENRNGAEPKWHSAYTEQCVAEARVMRAYLHMMTALIWNQPPLMDRVYEGDELPPDNLAHTQAEILQWVIDECQTAIDSGKLPKRAGKTDKDNTARMNVGFARFIAGKAAVFKNDMATARKYLGDLIASNDYELIKSEEYWTNFHAAGDGNAETIFDPNIINDPVLTSKQWARFTIPGGFGRDRWQAANVFNWRSKSFNAIPDVSNTDGWGGGAVQEDFAEKFYQHDGDSPRRKACFITEEEFLYELNYTGSTATTRAEMEKDPNRGLKAGGMFGHGKYFRWKTMSYVRVPKILSGGKDYPSDHIPEMGEASNQSNFQVARYAEALLLYAEACIGTSDADKGLKALQDVQKRSGSGKISSSLTFEAVMEEKQYEMWFENCRFLDLVRWSKLGKVDLDAIYNKSGIHEHVPTVHDEFSEKGTEGFEKYHKLYTTHDAVPGISKFVVNKHEYLPFPRDSKQANKNLHDVLGWATAEDVPAAQ